MASEVINFATKLARFSEHWSPRVVADMNDYQFKLVKLQGEFVWHEHKDTNRAARRGQHRRRRRRADCSERRLGLAAS